MTKPGLFVSIGLSMAVSAVAMACAGGGDPANKCADIVLPGVRALVPGILLSVRNRQGQASAPGTVATTTRAGLAPDTGVVRDSVNVAIDFLTAGSYDVRVSRPFYRDTMLKSVMVFASECGDVQTTNVSLVLETVANAPPVRSVAIYGAAFLAPAGTQAHLTTLVDADSGVSRAVTWQLSDTLLARIDQTGVVTGKCSVRGGADTVFATSVVNPAVRGATTFGVGANASC